LDLPPDVVSLVPKAIFFWTSNVPLPCCDDNVVKVVEILFANFARRTDFPTDT
jgi:hypothetical protein